MKLFAVNTVLRMFLLMVGLVVAFSTQAGQIVVGNAVITDAPMPSIGGKTEVSFNFVEMSGLTIPAGQIALTVKLEGITLKSSSLSEISGSALYYFNADFNSVTNTLLLTQSRDIEGFESGDFTINVEVVAESTASASSNGFEVYVNALSDRIIAGEGLQSYTFTK